MPKWAAIITGTVIITGITVITANGFRGRGFLLPAAAVDADRPAPMVRAGGVSKI
jgi:hypothetical protein